MSECVSFCSSDFYFLLSFSHLSPSSAAVHECYIHCKLQVLRTARAAWGQRSYYRRQVLQVLQRAGVKGGTPSVRSTVRHAAAVVVVQPQGTVNTAADMRMHRDYLPCPAAGARPFLPPHPHHLLPSSPSSVLLIFLSPKRHHR